MKLLSTILTAILGLFLFSNVALAQTASPSAMPESTVSATPAAVDSFDLFWPIVAGRTKGDPLYFLKSFKESLRELLIFSNFKKADYNITLSVKRTIEAEKLLLGNDLDNAQSTLTASQSRRDRAYELINKASADGDKVEDLINTLNSSLEKQELLLVSVKNKVQDDTKTIIDENINQLNALQEKLQ